MIDSIERDEGRTILNISDHYYSDPLEKLRKDRKFPDVSLDFNMKSGYLMKRGYLRKNWKQRYFIARNNAHNYCVEYYDDLEGRLKGTMECHGYKAEGFSPEETRTFGMYGIKLVPYDGHRRVWMIKCANEDEWGAWMHVFHTACYRSLPTRLEMNPLMVTAFSRCCEMLQRRYGLQRKMETLVGTEIDILVDLCEHILRKNILDPLLTTLPAGKHIKAREAFDKYIHPSVTADLTSSWQITIRDCKVRHASVEHTARNNLSALLRERSALLDSIWHTMQDEVIAALQDGVLTQVCEPLLARCGPAIEGYLSAEVGFVGQMNSCINTGKFASKELFDKMIAITHKFIQWDTSGTSVTGNAQSLCWKLNCSDLLRVPGNPAYGSVLPNVADYSPYDFYCDVLDSIRDLGHRAVGSFAARARDRVFMDRAGWGTGTGRTFSSDRAGWGAGTGRTFSSDRVVDMGGMGRSASNGQVENNTYHMLKELLAEVESEFQQEMEVSFTILLVTVMWRFVDDCPRMTKLHTTLHTEGASPSNAAGRMSRLESALHTAWLDDESRVRQEGNCLSDFYSLSYLVEECLRAHITNTLYETRNSMMHNV